MNATATDLVFADGNTIAQLKTRHSNCCGIEIALPSLGYVDVTEKSLFGASGALIDGGADFKRPAVSLACPSKQAGMPMKK